MDGELGQWAWERGLLGVLIRGRSSGFLFLQLACLLAACLPVCLSAAACRPPARALRPHVRAAGAGVTGAEQRLMGPGL